MSSVSLVELPGRVNDIEEALATWKKWIGRELILSIFRKSFGGMEQIYVAVLAFFEIGIFGADGISGIGETGG